MSKEMTPKELFDYRVKLFRDAQSWKKPDRTPFSANVTHWMFHDAGYTTNYAVRHYDVVEECMVRFYQKYPIDHFNIWMSGFRSQNAVTDLLTGDGGSDGYFGNDDNLINFVTEDMLEPDEFYDAFTADPTKATWELFLSRRYSRMKNMSPREFALSVRAYYDYLQARDRVDTRMREEFGILVEKQCAMAWTSLEVPFGGTRGIRGLSLDLRRRYDKVKKYIQVNDANTAGWAIDSMQYEGWNMTEPYDCMISMLPHTIMRPSQFEDLIWPVFEPVLQYAAEHGKQVINFCEGSWKSLGKYFNQFPKGTICMMVESDDPFELRKLYPNVALYGGLDTSVLGQGTKQQCIDMAKKAIDELGWDGGLILAPNKMLAYPNDVKAENLEAVCQFVLEYK